MGRHLGRIALSKDALENMLNTMLKMPDDSKVLDVWHDQTRDMYNFLVESSKYAEYIEGTEIRVESAAPKVWDLKKYLEQEDESVAYTHADKDDRKVDMPKKSRVRRFLDRLQWG